MAVKNPSVSIGLPDPTLVVPPAPPVVIPSTWRKNLPKILTMVAGALTAFGAYFQTSVMNDPAFVEQFGNWANVPGWFSMVAGVVSWASAELLKMGIDKDFSSVIATQTDHLEVVKNAATDQIAAAAEAPAVVPPTEDPLEFRVRLAMKEAIDGGRMADLDVLQTAFASLSTVKEGA